MSDVYKRRRERAVPILAPRRKTIYFLRGEEVELDYTGRGKWCVISIPRSFTYPDKHTNEDLSFLCLGSDINPDQLFVGKSIMGNIIVKIVDELHISLDDEIIISGE